MQLPPPMPGKNLRGGPSFESLKSAFPDDGDGERRGREGETSLQVAREKSFNESDESQSFSRLVVRDEWQSQQKLSLRSLKD